jgi:hypothetical protein
MLKIKFNLWNPKKEYVNENVNGYMEIVEKLSSGFYHLKSVPDSMGDIMETHSAQFDNTRKLFYDID